MPRLGTGYSEKLEHSGIRKSFQQRKAFERWQGGAVRPIFACEGAIDRAEKEGDGVEEGEEEVEEVEETEEATD